MLRGLHTAGSGMIAQQRYQDSLSNNMSNALTPGYKQDRGTFRAFPEMLIQNMQSQSLPTKRNVNIPNNQIVGSFIQVHICKKMFRCLLKEMSKRQVFQPIWP